MAIKATAQISLSSVVDVQATYRFYLLQSSTLTKPAKPTTYPPASPWDDVEPTYTSGSTTSLYLVDCTVFSDDTFAYSEVSLSSSYEAAKTAYNKAVNAQNTANSAQNAVDNMEIGGRNLFIVKDAVDGYLASDGSGTITAAGSTTKEKTSNFIPVTVGDEMQFQVWVTTPTDSYVWYAYQFFAADETPLNTSRPAISETAMTGGAYRAIYGNQIVVPTGAAYIRVSARLFEDGKIKVEIGNKPTDWTPATEDVSEDINSAQNTANDALVGVSAAEATIKQLADSISALVRDGNGGSLIKQDSSGLYYFNIGEIETNISDTANELDKLSVIVLDANGEIDVLKSTAEALQERTEYVRSYTDENGQPCIELGEGDSVFKVRITNTEIQFAEGTAVPARINRQFLVIEKAMVKETLQFGDEETDGGVWVWQRRSNGNLGLTWKGASS